MSRKPIIGITLDSSNEEYYSKYPWYAIREDYANAVAKFGAVPITIPHIKEAIPQYLEIIDGLILTGGDFDIDPKFYGEEISNARVATKDKRTMFEMDLCEKAMKSQLPMLGICAGHQLINVMQGGSLIQHIPDEVKSDINHEQPYPKHTPTHDVIIEKDSKFFDIVKSEHFKVNSTHHQAIKNVGKDLKVVAKSPDGVIEAIEHVKHPFCFGIEWHPEFLACKEDEDIMQAFVEKCRNGKS